MFVCLFVCLFVSTIFNEGAYLTIFNKALKDGIFANLQFENFENLERDSVSLLMLSAKQGNHWYHFYNVFGMPRRLAGIEHWTSRIQSEYCTTKLSKWLVVWLQYLCVSCSLVHAVVIRCTFHGRLIRVCLVIADTDA